MDWDGIINVSVFASAVAVAIFGSILVAIFLAILWLGFCINGRA